MIPCCGPILYPGPTLLGPVFSFVLAPLFLIHSKLELFHSQNRCVFSQKERDDCEQEVQQFLDQLRVALIEFALFDAIDELLNLGRISVEDIIAVFHRIRSRRSYAKQKRTPRPERKYFLFHDCLLQVHNDQRAVMTACNCAVSTYCRKLSSLPLRKRRT